MIDLWVDKYRPTTLDEYVWKDPDMRSKAEEWIASGGMPHALFAGSAGTGKTSLLWLLLRLMEIPNGDILYINASRERKVEEIQDKIGGFVNTWALGPSGIKYIIMDEFDAVTPMSQKMLRAEIEQYSDITRFLATANYLPKIIPALQSRFHIVHFQTLSRLDFIVRAGEILTKEHIQFELDDLQLYVDLAHPDMRKCIGLIQENSILGKLRPPQAGDGSAKDYVLDMLSLFKNKKFLEARKLILSQAQPEEYVDIYKFLYRNLDLFGDTQDKQDDALIIIAKGAGQHNIVADQEINLAATLAQLSRLL